VSDESKLQISLKDADSSLSLVKVRSGLIARGRKDAEMLAVLAEAESDLAPESEIGRLTYLHVSDDGRPLEDVLQAALNGDAKSQYQVADKPGLYNVDALTWLRRAAERGYAPAQFRLGVSLAGGDTLENIKASLAGKPQPQGSVQAVYWYRKAAEQGLNEAAFNVGSMYAHGEGVPRDYAEAARWYRKAAEQGLKEAQYNLGLMYSNGDGLPQDYAEAAKWYRKAAEQGGDEACFNLGLLYDTGKGVSKDSTEAAKWYLKAAEQSNWKAAFNIGLKYEKGEGVLQNYTQAYKWLHFATYDADDDKVRQEKYGRVRDRVAARLTPAQIVEALDLVNELADENAEENWWFDFTEAAKLYRKAAEQGHAYAQFRLGWVYAHGQGVPQDHSEAVTWYRKAAEQGHAGAQFRLGYAFDSGQGVPQDFVEAAKWYRKAADQGHAPAQLNLGWGLFLRRREVGQRGFRSDPSAV